MCVDSVARRGWSLGGGANFHLSSATKNGVFFLYYQVERTVWCAFFLPILCVHFDLAHLGVHMIQRFVIQGFPILMGISVVYIAPT